MSESKLQVLVFGKESCEKCKLLQRRLDGLLADPAWSDFEKKYCDVETEDGLVVFCKAECVNPNRIPAVIVARSVDGRLEYLEDPAPGAEDSVLKKSKLHSLVGLQTDYSSSGVVTPTMLTHLLGQARTAATRSLAPQA
jgi:hypothetical protein